MYKVFRYTSELFDKTELILFYILKRNQGYNSLTV